MPQIGFGLYLAFLMSWFLRMPQRVPVFGLLRLDLVLFCVLAIMAAVSEKGANEESYKTDTDKWLWVLLGYILLSTPFVQWPGSVVRRGLPNFVKAVGFFFFTKRFVDTEQRLRVFLGFFVACQSFRILEPLYLHLTEGYWGESAYMSGDFLDRLAGAPHDVIGANGLAFVILTVCPFLYFLSGASPAYRMIGLAGIPLSLYTLSLTGSRSGFVGLVVVVVGIIIKKRRRALVALGFAAVLYGIFASLSPEMQDRYLSVFDSEAKNAPTAAGRLEGVWEDFKVAWTRPLFGHGLGTSAEANYNVRGDAHLAHNLYAEVAQELGFVGLAIFLMFIKSVVVNFRASQKSLAEAAVERVQYLKRVNDAMEVWLGMNLLFSFASYGLSSYEWYLFAGFSVVSRRLSDLHTQSQDQSNLDSQVGAATTMAHQTSSPTARPRGAAGPRGGGSRWLPHRLRGPKVGSSMNSLPGKSPPNGTG